MRRLQIAIYAIWLNLINRLLRKTDRQRVVLIVFQQVFGDAVVFSSALQGFADLFIKQRGWRVVLICLPKIKKFWEEVAPVPDGIEIEIVDFKNLVNDFRYFKSIVARYDHFAELCVVTGSSLSADLLTSALSIKRRVGMVNVFPRRWPPQIALFNKLAYTEKIVPGIGTMMIQRNRMTLRYLGLYNFVGRLPVLKKQTRIIEGDYCVISPGASVPVKRWPIERYVEIANWIVEKKGWNVHICGGRDEVSDAMKLISLSNCPEKIISHVGRTGFKEWSSIIEYAQLVVGNDSATLHIAAAHRVPSVCITGIYDMYQFFPYLVDVLDEGDRLPETVFVEMPCAYCRTKGYFAGHGNPLCKKAIRSGKCSLCIEAVTVNAVKEKVKKLLSYKCKQPILTYCKKI